MSKLHIQASEQPNGATTGGLFDFQVNGFAGIDFQKDDLTREELCFALGAMRARGVAGILFTVITDTVDRICARFELLERLRDEAPIVPQLVWGYHLEGPWLRPEVGFCGAHRRELLCAPDRANFARILQATGGRLRMLTLAPEWPGSADFIRAVRDAGVHVALGHTNANEVEIDAAVAAGARFCTHLGNGVPLTLPRHDNVVQRLLARDELIASFIPDGVHLPPFVLQNLFRAKPRDRVVFTTDCMAAAGAPPGIYYSGKTRVQVGADGVVRNPGESGGFVGSSLTPDVGVERVAKFLRLPLAEAQAYWSRVPCEALGISAAEGAKAS